VVDYLPYIAIALIGAGIVGQALWRLNIGLRTKDGMSHDTMVVVSDWEPSGKIDFGCVELGAESDPALFHLRVEDLRILESISGTKRIELRWRNPTLAEAKEIAARYNGLPYERTDGRAIESPEITPRRLEMFDELFEPIGSHQAKHH
jgi:hypothetical protein